MHDMAMAMAMSMVIPVAVVVAVVMDGSEIHTFHPPSYSINLAYGMYYAAMLIQDDESIIEGKHEHTNHRPNSGPTIHHPYIQLCLTRLFQWDLLLTVPVHYPPDPWPCRCIVQDWDRITFLLEKRE
eukprot:279029_1